MTPEGTYHGLLVKAETTEAGTGNPQIVVTFKVEHVWRDDAWCLVAVGERRLFMALTDKARPYTADKLKALGFDGRFSSPRFSKEAINEGVQLLCKHETYNQQTREKWELADWGGGGSGEPLAADPLRALDTWYQSLQDQAAKPGGQPTTPPPAGMTPEEVDKDIPY